MTIRERDSTLQDRVPIERVVIRAPGPHRDRRPSRIPGSRAPRPRRTGEEARPRRGIVRPRRRRSPDWTLDHPPAGVEVRRRDAPLGAGRAEISAAADVTIVFARSEHELAIALARSGLLASRPRHSGSVGHVAPAATRAISPTASCDGRGLTLGLVDNKVAAVDADWSGLRFVTRREPREPARCPDDAANGYRPVHGNP